MTMTEGQFAWWVITVFLDGVIVGYNVAKWVRRRGFGPVPSTPLPPAAHIIDPPLPDLMQKALAQAPDSFANARAIQDVRNAMACTVCREGTELTCSNCKARVCMEHREPTNHTCIGA